MEDRKDLMKMILVTLFSLLADIVGVATVVYLIATHVEVGMILFVAAIFIVVVGLFDYVCFDYWKKRIMRKGDS